MMISNPVMKARAQAQELGMQPAHLYLSNELWNLTRLEARSDYCFYDESTMQRTFAGLVLIVEDDGNPRVVTSCGKEFPLDLANRQQL